MPRRRTADPGEPGHYYFEEPTVIAIESKKKRQPSSLIVMGSSGKEALALIGEVRLRSSHSLHNYIPPKDVVYDISEFPTQKEVNDYITRMSICGFGEGAIVTRRYQPKNRWKYPYQWGVIQSMFNIVPSNGTYRPFTVKWFANGDSESAWGEDLVVIHQAMDEDLISDIVESQGIDVS